MWFDGSVMYQIYPIGFCGAPRVNDGSSGHRLGLISDIIPHLKEMGVDCVMLNPVVKSSTHGYDTIDFCEVDNRLGTQDELKSLICAFHAADIKVVYDAVFNHVGRDYPTFRDVRQNGKNSRYKDWFYIDFSGNSRYNDGFSYQDWQGCAELVKLDLQNTEVRDTLFGAVRKWICEWDIDGLRLDAAHLLSTEFIAALKSECRKNKSEFPLIGEIVRINEFRNSVCESLMDSITDYECFSGMIRSVNQPNFFDIASSIERNFARGGQYFGKSLLNFVDNHDVTRAATAICDERNLPLLYALMFALPGVPCVYYGSEYSVKGDNKQGDEPLRPAFSQIDKTNDVLVRTISALAEIRHTVEDVVSGEYKKLFLTNGAYAFRRGAVVYAFNATDSPVTVDADGEHLTVGPHDYSVLLNGASLI